MNKPEIRTGNARLPELSYSKAWWLVASALVVAIVLGLGTLEILRLMPRHWLCSSLA